MKSDEIHASAHLPAYPSIPSFNPHCPTGALWGRYQLYDNIALALKEPSAKCVPQTINNRAYALRNMSEPC